MTTKQNIISFSLWGNKPKYMIGMEENCKLAPIIYPDWKVKIYVDNTVDIGFLRHLYSTYKVGIYSVGANTPSFDGMFWRMYPADDPTVGKFIIRDADSRLNWREKAAVDEWIASGKNFHIMRDHKNHVYMIQGGMWGGTAGVIPNMTQLINEWPDHSHYACDQVFLSKVIYPLVKNDCLTHDPYYENKPFPQHQSIEPGWFVGQIYDENGVPQKD